MADNSETPKSKPHGKGGAPKPTFYGMNLQQKLFCEIYVAQAPLFNQKLAAERAGYANPDRTGLSLMKKEPINAYINHLRHNACLRNNITLDDVINKYAAIAFFDPRTIYDGNGKLIGIEKFDDIAAACIESWEQDDIEVGDMIIGKTKKIKTYSRITALDRLRDCLGWANKEKKTKRDAQGNLVETEETEFVNDNKVIFEDHSGKLNDADIPL